MFVIIAIVVLIDAVNIRATWQTAATQPSPSLRLGDCRSHTLVVSSPLVLIPSSSHSSHERTSSLWSKVLVRCPRTIIPTLAPKFYEAHPVMTVMKGMASRSFWWPGIHKGIEDK